MTKEQEQQYKQADALRQALEAVLKGQKYTLDCGHHFTGGTNLGNDITIRNGKHLKIICSLCGY